LGKLQLSFVVALIRAGFREQAYKLALRQISYGREWASRTQQLGVMKFPRISLCQGKRFRLDDSFTFKMTLVTIRASF
jgi:hypothetical protein